MRDAINSLREDRGQPCLQFRMDDDDAVAVDFIEKLRNAAQNLRPLLRANRHVAIDFNHGFIATPSAAGITACPVVEPLWTPALAMSSKPRVTNTIMNFSHNRIGHKMPVLGLPDEAMFIRGHNDHNDSRQGANVRKRTLVALDDEARALFLSRFNIDEEQVRQIYGEA